MLTNPLAAADFFVADEVSGTSVAAPGVLGNDSDIENDPLSAVLISDVSSGTLALAGDGSFTYSPLGAGPYTDSFQYVADDGTGQSTSVTATIDVGDVPGDGIWAARGTSLTLNQKVEIGGLIGDGMNGNRDVDLFSVSLNAGEHLLIDIDADELDDGAPLSLLDSYLRVFDDMGTELASNDDAPDPDTLVNHLDSVLAFSPGQTGTYYIGVSGFGNNDYDAYSGYANTPGSTGEYRLQLTLTTNGAPVAADDTATVPEGSAPVSISVMTNDSDPDNDVMTLDSITQPANGTASISGSSVTYQPNAGYSGTDSFTYTISDPDGATDTGTVTVTVGSGGANSSPSAADDSISLTSGSGPYLLDVLANDSDPDGDSLQIQSVGSPQNGTASIDQGQNGAADRISYTSYDDFTTDTFSYTISDGNGGTATANVTVSFDNGTTLTATNDSIDIPVDSATVLIDVLSNDSSSDGMPSLDNISQPPTNGSAWIDYSGASPQIAYQPSPGFQGIDSLTYSISDTQGSTATATVTIRVGANNAPTASADSYSAVAGHTLTVAAAGVLANDTDQDGDSLSAVLVAGVSQGTLTLAADGSFAYTPDAAFSGTDSFTYQASDGSLNSSTVTVTLNVTPNTAPAAVSDSFAAITGLALNVAAADGVLANDSDPDGHPISTELVSGPANGTLTLNADGSFTYTSTAGFLGEDSFSYRPTDGVAAGNTVTTTITVYGGPVWAVDDSYSIGHDQQLDVEAVGVLGNDWDQDGDPLTASLVTPTSHGSITLHANGAFLYTPDPSYVGSDSFTYTVSDGTSTGNTATVLIDVTNHAPVAIDDYLDATAGSDLSLSIVLNDFDHEGDTLSVTQLSNVSNGSLVLNADGTFTYSPDSLYLGPDSFTYSVSDPLTAGSSATVFFNVVNSAPIADSDRYTLTVDTSLMTTAATGVLANDFDFDGHALSAFVTTGPANGTVTLASDGSFTYQPNAGFVGTDSFTYLVQDDYGGTDSGTVTLEVGNHRPIAGGDSYRVTHDSTLTATGTGVLANDSDGDDHSLTVQLVAAPVSGTLTLNPDGTFTYTPNAGFTGQDSFTYQASDGYETSPAATVTIHVENSVPVAIADFHGLLHDTSLNVLAVDGVLANDLDADGDALTATLGADVLNGILSFSADGSFSYTPNAGFTGSDSFTYAVSDGLISSDPATVTFTVRNSDPITSNDTFTVIHDRTLNVSAADGVLATDVDPDGDSLSATLSEQATNGTVTLNADGSFSYVPLAGFVGQDSFTYTASDGATSSLPVTVTIDVTNAAPVGNDRSWSTHQGTDLNVPAPGLLETVLDTDGDSLALSVTTQPASGALTVNADGSFAYVPDSGFAGTDSFVLTASDGVAVTDPMTVTVEVTNSAPIAFDDTYSTLHDQALSVSLTDGVLANDIDNDGDALALALTQNPTNGTVTLNADGTFLYTPSAGITGLDTFQYSISDGVDTEAGTVSIHITNAAPITARDRYGVLAGGTLNATPVNGVLANDSEPDGESLSVTLDETTGNGTLTLNADGSFAYTPDAGFTGRDFFSYTTTDGLATSPITVAEIFVFSDQLVAEADTFDVSHDQTATLAVLDNDFNDTGNPATVVIDQAPAHGTASVNPDGTISYTPNAGYLGDDSITYHLTTGTEDSASTTISLTVSNATPSLQGIGPRFSIDHDTTLTVTAQDGLLSVASDADGDSLSLTVSTAPATGTLTVNPDGSLTFIPTAGFTGPVTFEYTVSDGIVTTAPIVSRIDVWNQSPIVLAEDYRFHAGNVLSDNVLTNDIDTDTLTAALVDAPQNGTLLLNADGSFTYTHNTGWLGTDSFTYTVTDGIATSDPATVAISVENNQPFVNGESFEIRHDTALSGSVLTNEQDLDDDPLTASLHQTPQDGTLTLLADGTFTYTPDSGWVGSDSFQYTVSDGFSTSAPQTVAITVTNAAPRALTDRFVIDRGDTLTFPTSRLTDNDSDADGDALTFAISVQPVNGTLTQNAEGDWIWTPTQGFAGLDSFAYTLSDGIVASTPATVTIEVINDAPNVTDDAWRLAHDTTLSQPAGAVLANDLDLNGDSLTVTLLEDVAHGTLTLNADSSFTYTPDTGYVGRDFFRYAATDGLATSESATVALTVENHAPETHDTLHAMTHDGVLEVSAGDGLKSQVRDLEDSSFTFTLQASPGHGTVTVAADGSFTYTPTAGYAGRDSFVFTASDGVESSQAATVEIDVRNTAPVASSDIYTVAVDGTLTVSGAGVLENDRDLDNDALALSLLAQPQRGNLTWNGDGSFVYTPFAGQVGQDTFSYRISDGVESSVATVFVEVVGDLDSSASTTPLARDDRYLVSFADLADNGLAGDVLVNDLSTSGHPLSVELVTGPSTGQLTLNGDGSFDFTLGENPTASDSDITFSYRVTDSLEYSTNATVTIEVSNEVPWATSRTWETHQGTVLTVAAESGVTLAAGDAENDALTFEKLTDPTNGTATFAADGSFEYTPNAGYTGTDSFTFRASDGLNWSTAGTAVVSVTNHAPEADGNLYHVTHGETLTVAAPGLLATARDADADPLTAVEVSSPSHGQLTLNADGSFTYEAAADYAGQDRFRFKVNDGADDSHVAEVVIEVRNSDPVVLEAARSLSHGTSIDITPAASDADGDALTFEVVTAPASGTLTFASPVTVPPGDPARFTGTFTYTPTAGFTGDDSVILRATDGVAWSDPVDYSFTVTNFQPVASDFSAQTPAGTELTLTETDLLARASDGDGDALTIEVVSQPQNGTAVLLADGSIRYTPAAGFAASDSFTWRVADAADPSEPATVSVTVENTRPVASGIAAEFHHAEGVEQADGSMLFEVLPSTRVLEGVDADGHTLAYIVTQQPQSGSVAFDTSGKLTYVPDSGSATSDVHFSWKVNDGYADSDEVTTRLRVTNTDPIALSDWFNVHAGSDVEIDLVQLAQNDFDVNADDVQIIVDPNSLSWVDYSEGADPSPADLGTITVTSDTDGSTLSATYTPPATLLGTVSFSYSTFDGAGYSDPSTVRVSLQNSTPITTGGTFTGESGSVISIGGLADQGLVSDPDGDTLSFSLAGGSGAGNVSNFGTDGSFDYTVGSGVETVDVAVTDGFGQTRTITLTLGSTDSSAVVANDLQEQDPPNRPPIAAPDGWYYTPVNSFVTSTVGLLVNDVDPDGDVLTVIDGGGLAVDASGSFTYYGSVPGTYNYTYTVSDGELTGQSTVKIIVGNSPPDLETHYETMLIRKSEADTYTLMNVIGGEPDGDDIVRLEITSPPPVGEATIGIGDGTTHIANGAIFFTYLPPVDYEGIVSFDVEAEDEWGLVSSTTVTVWVTDTPTEYGHEVRDEKLFTAYLRGVAGAGGKVTSYTAPPEIQVTLIPGEIADSFDLEWIGSLDPVPGGDVTYEYVRGAVTGEGTITLGPSFTSSDHPGGYGPWWFWYAGSGSYAHPITSSGHYRYRRSNIPGPTIISSTPTSLEVSATAFAGPVSAGKFLHAVAGGSISAVSAGVLSVSIGGSIGSVIGGTAYSVSAGQNIDYVEVTGDIVTLHAGDVLGDGPSGKVEAFGNINFVGAGLIKGNITAGGYIGHITSSGAILGDIFANVSIGQYGGSAYAVHAIDDISGDISTFGAITSVKTVKNLSGDVASINGSIGLVEAMQDITGSVGAAAPGQSIGRVYAWRDIVQPTGSGITAGGAIPEIYAGRDLVSTINADEIGDVEAFRNIEASISATQRILNVSAGLVEVGGQMVLSPGEITNTSIVSGQVGTVFANGDIVNLSVAALSGYIESVKASGALGAVVAAATTIGQVQAMYSESQADLTGSVSAGQGIGIVQAASGSIIAPVSTTSGSIGTVSAQNHIYGSITAGDSITSIEATEGDIIGLVIDAGESIGSIVAGKSILIPISAGDDINRISAGSNATTAEGNITGGITAGGSIGRVVATVTDMSAWSGLTVGGSSYTSSVYSGIASGTYAPPATPVQPPSVVGGDIVGNISSGGSIELVFAAGDLTGNVTASSGVGDITAIGDITATVDAGQGSVNVNSWGTVTGDISAVEGVTANAFESLNGSLTSTRGSVKTTTFTSLNATVTSDQDASLFAIDGINGGGNSLSGRISAASFGDVTGTIQSQLEASISAVGEFDGTLISRDSDALASSLRGMTGIIEANGNLIAATIDDMALSVKSGAELMLEAETVSLTSGAGDVEGSAYIYAHKELSGAVTSSSGDIYVNAGKINGTLSAPAGRVAIDVYGSTGSSGTLSGTVNGENGVVGRVRGSIESPGSVVSPGGNVRLSVTGEVNAPVTAHEIASVVAWGGINQDVTSTTSSVVVFSNGDLNGKIDAKQNANVSVWGNVPQTVDADGSIELFARHNISGAVTAGSDAELYAGGNVIGNIVAGRHASAVAHGDISGDVTGSGNALADALGSVSGDVRANAGHATVSALGDVTGIVAATDSAFVTAGGGVSSSTIDAGTTVRVTAHGTVNGTTITAPGTTKVVADGAISNVTVTSGGEKVAVASLGNVDTLTVTKPEALTIFAGGNATGLDVTAGTIHVSALEDVSGEIIAADDLAVTGLGSVSVTKAEATGGELSVVSLNGISGTLNGAQSIELATGGSISTATISSFGTIGAQAKGSVSGTIKGVGSVSVVTGGSASGSIQSAGSIELALLGSSGTASTTVNSGRNAVITALGGSISGPVMASGGTAILTAENGITGNVTALKHADLWALGNVGSMVQAGGTASVAALGSVGGSITSTGSSATAVAGVNVSATVNGNRNAFSIARTGNVSGNVDATSGTGTAIAGANVTADVNGLESAMAMGLGGVDGAIDSAGHAWALSMGGSVSGSVTAGESAGVIALASSSSTVDAGTEAIVVSLGDVSGNVTAGTSASVIAGGNASGTVDAAENATVIAAGNATGNITFGETGYVSTTGRVSGNLGGGELAVIESYGTGGVTSTISADDVLVSARGDTSVTVNATANALISSLENVDATIIAGENALVSSGGDATTTISAGEDAYVWALDSVGGSIDATGSVAAVSLGTSNISLTAGEHAGVWAVDSTGGTTIDAGGYASLVSLGLGGGVFVNGADGVFTYSHGPMGGALSSSAGPVIAVSDSSIPALIVNAATDAGIFAIGTAGSAITAGQDAVVVGLGGVAIGGGLDAGGNAAIFSEGTVTAWPLASAGKDISVVGHADVSGNFSAGRDASVVAYGSVLGSSVTAGRDIGYASNSAGAMAGVWAGGDINASISAGRNVGAGAGYGGGQVYVGGSGYSGSVYAFGDFSGSVSAGGSLQSISAVGPVHGWIHGGTSIGGVNSGDAVTASISSPVTGAINEYDATLAAATAPAPPAARGPQLATDAATAVAEILADLAAVDADYVTMRADIDGAVADVLTQIAETRAETATAVADAQAGAASALAEEVSASQDTFTQAQQQTVAGMAQFYARLTGTKQFMQFLVNAVRDARNELYDAAVEFRNLEAAVLTDVDQRMTDLEQEQTRRAAIQRSVRDIDWDEKVNFSYTYYALHEVPELIDELRQAAVDEVSSWPGALWDSFVQQDGAISQGLDKLNNYFAGHASGLDPFDVMEKYRKATGWDYVDYDSGEYRAGKLVGTAHSMAIGFGTGSVAQGGRLYQLGKAYIAYETMATTAIAADNIISGEGEWTDYLGLLGGVSHLAGSRLNWLKRNPCGCFDYDTGVKEFAPEAMSQTWLVVAAGVISAGGGWIAAEEVRRRKRLALGQPCEDEDPLLGPDDQNDDHVWMMTRVDESLPGVERGDDFDVLCDLLFNGPPRSSGRR